MNRKYLRFGTEDQSLVLPTGIGPTVFGVGKWRLRSLPIAAGTILWSPLVFADDDDDDDDDETFVWLLLAMMAVGSAITCVGTGPFIGSTN